MGTQHKELQNTTINQRFATQSDVQQSGPSSTA